MASCEEEGRAALAEAGPGAEADPMWRLATWRLADEDKREAFARMHAHDPYNSEACGLQARMLMTRWHGEYDAELNEFALRCSARSADRMGEGMYALIHQWQTDVDEFEVADACCDVDRARRGFEDLMQRFPSQRIANAQANFLCWAGLDVEAGDLIGARLKAVIPVMWAGDTLEEQLVDAGVCLEPAWDARMDRDEENEG